MRRLTQYVTRKVNKFQMFSKVNRASPNRYRLYPSGTFENIREWFTSQERLQIFVGEHERFRSAILRLDVNSASRRSETRDEARLLHFLRFPTHGFEFRTQVGVDVHVRMIRPQKVGLSTFSHWQTCDRPLVDLRNGQ